jgi:cell cycle sensor histidine kinase DivJ
VNILAPVRDYVDTLVHPSAQHDALTAARHRAFIAPRLLGSFAALAAFPVYLAVRGIPSTMEVFVFAWLVAPILIAYFLSRTGHYEGAYILSSLTLTGLVMAVSFKTGGIGSFAAIWLVVVPLEAALSASRRAVAAASCFALGAAAVLVLLGAAGLIPAPSSLANQQGALAALGIISASLYAIGLALGTESLAQTSLRLLYSEEERYRLLALNMTDVITRHGRNGAVLFASPAAERLFGIKAEDLLRHGLFDRIHVTDRPAYLTGLADASASGELRSVEFRSRRDDGRLTWIEMRCRPLDGNAGEKMVGDSREVVAVLRDISDRKAQEETLEQARAEADRAHAAKSLFVATMSHELRTPLNVIIGFSEMMTKDAPVVLDAARHEEYAKLINDSGRHLLSVVNGILDMSKIETGNFQITPEPFAPAAAIASCCDLMRLKASDAGVALNVHVGANIPEMVADRRALNQILLNLLSNAIKFTGRGGRVSVSARPEGPFIVLTVEDTGAGIAAEDIPRLGDPFFQAGASYDRKHDGTGLGLSIVKGLVKLHNGDVKINSRLGEGTCITIRIPMDCERQLQPQSHPRVSRLPVAGTVTPDYQVKKIA